MIYSQAGQEPRNLSILHVIEPVEEAHMRAVGSGHLAAIHLFIGIHHGLKHPVLRIIAKRLKHEPIVLADAKVKRRVGFKTMATLKLERGVIHAYRPHAVVHRVNDGHGQVRGLVSIDVDERKGVRHDGVAALPASCILTHFRYTLRSGRDVRLKPINFRAYVFLVHHGLEQLSYRPDKAASLSAGIPVIVGEYDVTQTTRIPLGFKGFEEDAVCDLGSAKSFGPYGYVRPLRAIVVRSGASLYEYRLLG